MTKNEYLESMRGVPYADIVAMQPRHNVVGSIRGEDLRDVVTIFANGLKYRCDMASPSPIRTAILTAYDNLLLPGFALNFGLPEVMGLLVNGLGAGLIAQDEYEKFIELASYETAEHNITIRDCVEYFEPERISVPGEWRVAPEPYVGGLLKLRLLTTAPEVTQMVIQLQDIYDDGTESEWYHGTAIHGLQLKREYPAVQLPTNGYQRRLRWSCPYVLDLALTVV